MKKAAKPRITKPRLTWRWNTRKGAWEPYHRVTWTSEGKRKERSILLQWEGDAEKLDQLYWACEAGRHPSQKPEAPKHSWDNLVIAWRSDPRIQRRLSDSTKSQYARVMDGIREKNGSKSVRHTTKAALRAAHDKLSPTPRKADRYIQTIKMLWNYATDKLDWPLGPNPAKGIELFGAQREYEPWPEWMVKDLKSAPKNVRLAAELILGTGQRPSAAIGMRHDHFSGEWMRVKDEKGGNEFEVYCPEELRETIAATPKTGAHILAKNLSEPLGYDAIERAFRNWRSGLRDEAKSYVLHGLRKLAIVRLAEAGCSDAEIQAVTGQSAEMVAYYRKMASRKALSKNAMTRNRTKTE